ncbi:MAG: hypothetical protein ACYTJ0_15060 [Planctomycetota bacterium]|jgi:hypothetical protein
MVREAIAFLFSREMGLVAAGVIAVAAVVVLVVVLSRWRCPACDYVGQPITTQDYVACPRCSYVAPLEP